jgi:hypothetical protein
MKARAGITLVCLAWLGVAWAIAAQVEARAQSTQKASRAGADSGLGLSAPSRADRQEYTFLNGRQPSQTDAVKVQLKVSGEGIDNVDQKEHREKMSVECRLGYLERTLAVAADGAGLSRTVRSYNQADVLIKIGNNEFKPALRPERTLIIDEITPQAAALYCPRGPLTREELDLIEVPGNSLLLDQLLPEKPVAEGDAWRHSEKLMARLLGLDEVGQTDVESRLKEVTDKVARFEMSGNVAGAVDGVAAEIEIKARYRFDLRLKRIDWSGMVIKEKRRSSPVSDGLDVSAVLQMTIVPAGPKEGFSEAALKDLPGQATPELLRLSQSSKQGGWELLYDRNWHIYRDQQDAAVLRRIEGGELIAQCNLSSLPQAKADKLVSLEEFQDDIKQALAKEFQEYITAGQTMDQSGRRVLRVAVRGTASELPILWTYYHITNPEGRQMGLVFTLEEKYAERFARADAELVDGLRFMEQGGAKEAASAAAGADRARK